MERGLHGRRGPPGRRFGGQHAAPPLLALPRPLLLHGVRLQLQVHHPQVCLHAGPPLGLFAGVLAQRRRADQNAAGTD